MQSSINFAVPGQADPDFYKRIKIGRCIESLDWYSLISIKGMTSNLEDVLANCNFELSESGEAVTKLERRTALPYCSLLERVLLKDFHEFKDDDWKQDLKYELNFNRLETFRDNQLWLEGEELLQRDLYFKTAIHYLRQDEVQESQKSSAESRWQREESQLQGKTMENILASVFAESQWRYSRES